TSDSGGFRFQGLYPGVFTVRVSAPKLKTVVQEGVRVSLGSTTDVDLIMEVETVAEEVKIIQRAPMVNTSSAKVGVNFDEEFMNSLPLQSRDYQGVIALAAGVNDSGNGNPKVRGGTYFSNSYTVDGFNTTDPVTRTFGQNFSFSAMSSVEVTTAGGGAEASGTSGGSFNTVTKSGSNRFEVDVNGHYTDQNLELFRDRLDQGGNRHADVGFGIGGPIIKDKLWYFVSGQYVDAVASIPVDPNLGEHPPIHLRGGNAYAKLTWQLAPRHQLELLGTGSPGVFNNILQDPLVEAEAEARRFQRAELLGLSWQYRGDPYIENRVKVFQSVLETTPQRCQWDPNCSDTSSRTDLLTGISRENYTSQRRDQRHAFEANGKIELMRDSRSLGGHVLTLGYMYESTKADIRSTVPGDATFGTVGADPFNRVTYCSNDPLKANGMCNRNFLVTSVTGANARIFLTDAWKPTRHLTLKPGGTFHYGTSENDMGVQITDITAWTPHIAVVWDPTRDGKTKLQASFNGVVDTGFLALARFTSRQLYGQQCNWDPSTGSYSNNCQSFGGSDSQTVGLPCGPTGFGPDGQPCNTKLRPPRVWEATLGGEREVATGISVGAIFIYKKFVHQWEDAETNANWNEGGTDLRRDGPFKSSRAQFVYDLQTPDAARRLYRGVTVQARKSEGRLKGFLAYTLSRAEGSSDTDFAGSFLDNPPNAPYFYGPLPGDNLHDVRASLSYAVTRWLSLGVNYRFYTGGPYNRYYFDPVYQGYSRFQAQRGYDSQGNTNPDDDLALRLPDISELDLQARASLAPLIKVKLEAFADLFNILALRTYTSYVQQDGPFFGRPASRLDPTNLRVGLRYRY
ncbi:MAG TPA: hypothetical protein VGF45_18070, partial [Polyangia bacterium]